MSYVMEQTMAILREKDATIKALADVLAYLRDNDSVSDDGRARIKAALRIAGR